MAIFLLFVALTATATYGYVASSDPTTIAPGVAIGTMDMSGRKSDEAKQLLRDRLSSLRLTFNGADAAVVIEPNKAVATFNVDEAVKNAFNVGRGPNFLASLSQRVRTSVFGTTIPLPYVLDRTALKAQLAKQFSDATGAAQNARLVVRVDAKTGKQTVTVAKEQEGTVFDLDQAVRDAEIRLRHFSAEPIPVRVVKDRPQLAVADIEPLVKSVAPALERAPITLTVKDQTWTVSEQLLAGWMSAVPTTDGAAKAALGLDRDKVAKYLDSRAVDLAVAPKNAVFIMENGRVTTFEPSESGEKLDIEKSIAAIADAVFNPWTETKGAVALAMAEVPASVDTGASNPYGIREIVGVGESNFMGSPRNRRHNIAIGAAAVNGTMVMSGEEFSLLKTLGEIDAKAGYLPELVIKENKTVPELGGGLCQIGSTAFRVVLDSGLPVTARQNHSYRVPYYERDGDGKTIGPGKDATIYNPNPDFKFLNDTAHAVLITTKIVKDRLTFTMWGTRDGRKAEQTAAKVYNVVAPPPKLMIETDTLAPGVIKCTEKAHVGSDAIFTYTVTYPNGEVKVKDFKSHYRPWREVCLIGIDPTALPADSGSGALPSADAEGATGR